jgi:hypothetical protein
MTPIVGQRCPGHWSCLKQHDWTNMTGPCLMPWVACPTVLLGLPLLSGFCGLSCLSLSSLIPGLR